MAEIPHFGYPFRFEAGAASVVEQDSKDEVMTCALAVVLCPIGFRVELPTFGITDPTFSQGVPNPDVIAAALAEWEPRAQHVVASEPDAFDAFISYVTVRIVAPAED